MFQRGWWLYFCIGLFVFMLYAKCLWFNFIYLDDNVLVLQNYPFLRSMANILNAFKQDVFIGHGTPDVYYRPMVTISLMLDAQVSGTSPFVYHLTNILLHSIGSLSVFHLLKRLDYPKPAAFGMGFVFAAHPLFASAVAWIPGRNDIILAIFSLWSFIWYLDFLRKGRIKSLLLHLGFFGLALLSKENALFLLPVIICHYIFVLGKRDFISGRRRLLLGWFCVISVWFLLRKFGLKSPLGLDVFVIMGSLYSAVTALPQILGKILFPFNLSVMPTIEDTPFVYGFAAMAVLGLMLGLSKGKRLSYIFFGAVWFLLFLVPSFMRPDRLVVGYFLEHRVYLPFVGFLIILFEVDFIKHINLHKLLPITAFSLVIFYFSLKTFVYADNFKNRLNFYESAVRSSPGLPLAHRNLGAIYYLDGKLDRAEEEFKEALRINTYEPMANNNLGLVYMKRGRFMEAEQAFLRELSFNPDYDDANFNLGLLYYKLGRNDDACRLWEKTLKINPGHKQALECLKLEKE
jgi:hypothetical protein